MNEAWVTMQIEGVRACACSAHPLLVLREVRGHRAVSVRLPNGEARLLAHESQGRPTRHSRTLATIVQLLVGLGAVPALRLVGDWETGLRGEIEVELDARHVRATAHPGDVVALVWRLGIPVLVPSAVVPDTAPFRLEKLEEWRPDYAALADAPPDHGAFRRFLEEVAPEDFRD